MISDESFPKKAHLLKSMDFNRAYRKGQSIKNGPLVLYRLQNGLDYNRIGFSIGAKNVRLASSRARIRRLLREAYRRNKKDLKMGFDMVLVVKKDPGEKILYKDMGGGFLRLVRSAGLFK